MTPYHFFYVYILESIKRSGNFYIGFTHDLRKRLSEHNESKNISTKRYLPWKLIYYEAFSDKNLALTRETSLKFNGNPMRELKKRIMTRKSDKGFIALISVIIISVLLLTIAVTISMTGIFGRFNILDSESKERSVALSEACADMVILETSQGIYSTNKLVDVGPTPQDTCTIVSAVVDSPIAGQTLIKTRSVINKSYTNLDVIIDSDYVIISWQEVANHP